MNAPTNDTTRSLAATAAYDPEVTRAYLAALAPGETSAAAVGGYRLLRELGSGGMGHVYEAEHLATGRRVALKVIRAEYAAAPGAVDRFRREGRYASTITHPRCVFVVTAEEDKGRPFLVMELMPGKTLKDLVTEKGPLAPPEAVAKILDVIEGLEELHRRGMIHRDVKPSNCFLEPNGRVKVGDFGLAFSILDNPERIQQGLFVGTPQFASPEQHRGETLDPRTDVYSVSATLYYLLTGKPPFEGRDLSTLLERIASAPAEPLRTHRADLPAALERIVQRGLERDRTRRWQSLRDLKLALLRFGPGRQAAAGVWPRVAAYAIDYVVALAIFFALGFPLYLLVESWWPGGNVLPWPSYRVNLCNGSVVYDPNHPLLSAVPEILYLGVLEGVLGCGLGKWLLGLRVVRAEDGRPIRLWRGLARAAFFCYILYLPRYLLGISRMDCTFGCLLGLLSYWNAGGALLLLSTMRERNGYRGLHDWLFGTRVVWMTWPDKHFDRSWLDRPCPHWLGEHLSRPPDLPSEVGPFAVCGVLGQREEGVLVAHDAALGRDVLLRLRRQEEASLPASRREVNRLTRLRWLADGTADGTCWDAFIAEDGCPLPELVTERQPFTWEETRTLLQHLSDELASACAEGIVPHSTSPSQVWVQSNGRVLLFDLPRESDDLPTASDQERALKLLARTAILALEGMEREPDVQPSPVRAPLPLHAAQMLARLVEAESPYQGVAEFQAALHASLDKPARVHRARRGLQILLQGILFLIVCLLYLVLPPAIRNDAIESIVNQVLFCAIPTVAIVWATLARGGPTFMLSGIVLVRRDGRRAAWWQAGWRSVVAWLHGSALVLGLVLLGFLLDLCVGGGGDKKSGNFLAFLIYGFPVLFVLYVVLVIWLPRRSLHDWLSGTYLMPR